MVFSLHRAEQEPFALTTFPSQLTGEKSLSISSIKHSINRHKLLNTFVHFNTRFS